MVPNTQLVNFATPTAIPPSPTSQLVKRNGRCGSLDGQYPNAQPPICDGATPYCTFTMGFQGCCDENGGCIYYTRCSGGLEASATSGGEYFLQCPRETPYCSKFEFIDKNSQYYEGYACGPYDPGVATIFGYVENESMTDSPSVAKSTETSYFSNISLDSSETAAASTTTSSSRVSTGGSSLEPSGSTHHSHKSAIIGGAVGGILALLLIGAIIYFIRKARPLNGRRRGVQELQQRHAAMRQVGGT